MAWFLARKYLHNDNAGFERIAISGSAAWPSQGRDLGTLSLLENAEWLANFERECQYRMGIGVRSGVNCDIGKSAWSHEPENRD